MDDSAHDAESVGGRSKVIFRCVCTPAFRREQNVACMESNDMTDFQFDKLGSDQDILVVALAGRLDALRCDYMFGCIEHLINDGSTKLVDNA